MGAGRAGMRRPLRRGHLVAIVAAATVGIAALGGVAHSRADAAPDSLPGNCQTQPTSEVRPDICPSLPTHETGNGQRPFLQVLPGPNGSLILRYRFDAVLWNAGGAFELVGTSCTTGQASVCSNVIQRIWEGDGTPGGDSYEVDVDGPIVFDVGDGHNHYHFQNAAQYEIVVPNGANIVARKVGFCMFDTYADPDNSVPDLPKFYTSSCVLTGNGVKMGLSRGWGDHYPTFLEHQWVVVTGLKAGTYTLRAEVNPGREFTEANTANNVLDTPREIPGATAQATSATTQPGTPVSAQLAGTVEGKTVAVYFGTANRPGQSQFEPDADDDLDFTILSGPANGTLSSVTTTGDTTAQVIYTPNPGHTGTDTFTYKTTESRGLDSAETTVTINVEGPAQPPPGEPDPVDPTTGEAPAGSNSATSPSTTLRVATLVGTFLSETIRGTGAPETIIAKAGNDLIYARGGRDTIRAGKGRDRIFAGGGRDRVFAGKGADVVRARDGKVDRISCGRGNDRVIADEIDKIDKTCEVVLLPA
jgi:hypothetical protein